MKGTKLSIVFFVCGACATAFAFSEREPKFGLDGHIRAQEASQDKTAPPLPQQPLPKPAFSIGKPPKEQKEKPDKFKPAKPNCPSDQPGCRINGLARADLVERGRSPRFFL